MSAAALQIGTLGRGAVFGNLSAIAITVTMSTTPYLSSGGGLAIDLLTILQAAAPAGWDAPNYIQALNPSDIVGISPIALTSTGFLPLGFALGTPTYSAVPWQSTNGVSATPGILLTCPATIRLYGTGASNAAALAEIADGNINGTVTFLLLVARNGANS